MRDYRYICVPALLKQITVEAPCGDDLSNGEIATLQQVAMPVKKQEIIEGIPVWTDDDPDWRKAEVKAREVLDCSRDLRAAVLLAQAAAAARGISAFAEVLELIDGLVTQFWDQVHPAIEEEDGYPDASLRTNALRYLGDPATTLRLLRLSVLFSVRSVGPIRLRDIDLAYGRAKPREDERSMRVDELNAALGDADPQEIRNVVDAAAWASCHVVGIELAVRRFAEASGNAQQVIDLKALKDLLAQVTKELTAHAGPEDVTAPVEEALADTGMEATFASRGIEVAMPSEASSAGASPEGRPNGHGAAVKEVRGIDISAVKVRSRADVMVLLDRICAYYAATEPSSPVPLLLERARGLIDKNFLEILKDLAPSGLPEAAGIVGERQQDA